MQKPQAGLPLRRCFALGSPQLIGIEIILIEMDREFKAIIAVVLDLMPGVVVRDDKNGKLCLRIKDPKPAAAVRQLRFSPGGERLLHGFATLRELGTLDRAKILEGPLVWAALDRLADLLAKTLDQHADAGLLDG